MLKDFIRVASIVGLLSLASVAHSQALPTAVAKGQLQVGFDWSYAKPDYGEKAIQGAGAYADFNFLPHIGAEAEYHYISLITPTDLGENSLLVGPRFVLPHGRFDFYAKGLIGIGDIVIQEVADNPEGGAGRYTAIALGGGIDVAVSKHIIARGDFEYQHWNYLTGLTPAVITFGASYRFR